MFWFRLACLGAPFHGNGPQRMKANMPTVDSGVERIPGDQSAVGHDLTYILAEDPGETETPSATHENQKKSRST